MLNSIVIRHPKTEKSWDDMDYTELVSLLKQETEPKIDLLELEKLAKLNSLKNEKFNVIYSSPSTRARMTSEFLSKKLGLRVVFMNELKEIVFEGIPRNIFDKGTQAKREYLVDMSYKINVENKIKKIFELMQENAIIVSHTFFMRRVFSRKFGVPARALMNDKRFTSYLSGFESETGKGVFLSKI